ncbi:hypothetical protein STAQ_15260 [Allostella sp. ATCC 35155]|nr:hypothetical protein STAQ_15260 [Stella sp. ATCC 35155]
MAVGRTFGIAILLLAGMAGPAAAGDPFEAAVRALHGPPSGTRSDPDRAFAEAGPDASGWHVRRQMHGIEQMFLVNTLQVARSRLPLPSGFGLAVTAYDVLGGRITPRQALAGQVEGEAQGLVFAGVQSAMLWLAAKAVTAGGAASVAGAGVSAATVPATAPAAGAAVAPLSAGKVAAMMPGPLADFVLFGAAGIATFAAAGASAALGWGWQHYQEAALRAAEAEGLLQGAERVLGQAPLPPG